MCGLCQRGFEVFGLRPNLLAGLVSMRPARQIVLAACGVGEACRHLYAWRAVISATERCRLCEALTSSSGSNGPAMTVCGRPLVLSGRSFPVSKVLLFFD